MAYILKSLIQKYKIINPHFVEMTYLYNLELKSSIFTFGARSWDPYNFDGKTVLMKKSF